MGKRHSLKLPEVTLVLQETREHPLALLALEDCLKVAEFGDVLILTDRPLEFSSVTHLCNPRIQTIPDWPDKIGWARAMWFMVPPLVHTSHMLCIQWDSWIINPAKWTPAWLMYDYIGAPWPFHNNRKVGNSGFCLKSLRLARHIRDRRDKYPCDTWVEDDLLCRKYRHELEETGFVWAPECEAEQFSFECSEPKDTFGFHAAFNFSHALDHEALLQRARLMFESRTISQPIMKAFCEASPTVVKELMDENGKMPLVANKGD